MLVLASASPARLRLLRQAGLEPLVVVSDVDEDAVAAGLTTVSVGEVAGALARAKAHAVAGRPGIPGGALVLGCDSIFEMDGGAYGKPRDPEEARRRLRSMRGRSGTLHTGHCLVDVDSGATAMRVVATEVAFAPMSDAEIDWYVATGEPLAVAGSFTLDGYSAPYVAGVVGDPGNVMGVSLPAVRDLAAELGRPWAAVVGAR